MRQIFGLLLLFSLVACGDRNQITSTTNIDTTTKSIDAIKPRSFLNFSILHDFDKKYSVSKEHKPFMLTGYFNLDKLLDTAILIRHKLTGKDALFIKHGGTDKYFLLKNGKDLGSDFEDFNWVGQFEKVKKGTKIFNNVIDGEIVGEKNVPEKKKFILKTEGILLHEEEGGGGGIIYFKNGKYVWLQQD